MRSIAFIMGFLFLSAAAFADVVGILIVHAPPRARVVVKNLSVDKSPVEGDADERGSIKFDSLPIGDYSVTVNGETQSVVIRVNAVTEISFPIEKVIKVTSKRLLMNAKDTAGSSTFKDRNFIETRMADDHSLASVADLSPGVTADSQGLLHFRGEHRSMSIEMDGVLIPIPLQSQIGSLVDPRFLEEMEVRTGSFDPTFSGQLGGVLNLLTRSGGTKPFLDVRTEAGDHEETGGVVGLGGGDPNGTFNYFFGDSANHTNLRLEAPNPNFQTLNNQGDDENSLLHLTFNHPDDKINVTLATQNLRLNLPNTPSEETAGVKQWQRENNILGVVSLRHYFSENLEMLFGLSFLGSHQAVGNNGIFNPWIPANPMTMPDAAAEMLPQNPEDPGNPFLPNLSRTGSQKLFDVIFTDTMSDQQTIRWGGTANFIRMDDTIDIVDAGNSGLLPGGVHEYVAQDHRNGFDGGLFAGDTLALTSKLSANIGVRLDRYDNGVNVDTMQVSPLFNFSYAFSQTEALRGSFDRLFTAPPLEPDPTGATNVVPQKTSMGEISYEVQPANSLLMKIDTYEKNYTDPLDLALLVPLSNLPVFVPINFPRGQTVGVEFSLITRNKTGLNGFFNFTGTSMHIQAPTPGTTMIPLVDHFENSLITFGPSYQWKNGTYIAFDDKYGSGFPQDAIVAYNKDNVFPFGIRGRQSRFISDVKLGFRNPDFEGSFSVLNLFNNRRILNLLSNYSGTRFVEERRFLIDLTAKF